MAKIESSFFDIRYLDTLSYQDTSIHRVDPRAKLLATLVYIVTVVSFNKYEITGLIPFMIFPIVLVAVGNLPPVYLIKKLILAAPFAFFIGIFNPLFDRQILMHIGPLNISGGWVSFASILLRFVLTVSAALVLVASTGFNGVCMALEKTGIPRSLAVQLLFLYRYIFVLVEEASRIARARSLRAFGARGMGIRVFGSMSGQMLLRTIDRGERIHQAMLCRGFDGEIRILRPMKFGWGDVWFFMGWSVVFVLMRLYNVSDCLGKLVMGIMG
jgi:cobalt/nickel transport system permease protein